MAKEELKQYIDDNIYENQDGEITGESLNAVLKAIVDDGGTKVEANPDGGGKPSILRRIKIDDEVYEAPIGPQGDPGATGDNAYIHIKYAASVPTSDSDMHATPQSGDKFIGVYSGDSSTAPTSYTSYTWSKYVGEDGANGQSGAPGAQGDNAYVHIKYAASVPSSDSDMHATPQSGDKFIGVYSGDSSTAPTSYTSYTWSKYVGEDGANGQSGAPGAPGDNAYIHIKYAASVPSSDSDMHATPQSGDKYIGVYSGDSSTPPTSFTSYKWSKYVGEDGANGQPGDPGDNAYVHIKYAASVPSSDSDMHATPQSGDKYIGVYSGDSSTAPTSYTSYTWSKYVGENGANGQSIKYINAEEVEDLPTASSSYSNVVALVPSTTQQGVVDQYACIENAIVEGQTVSGWSWVPIGTTEPIVSVQEVDVNQAMIEDSIDNRPINAVGGWGSSTTIAKTYIYTLPDGCDAIFVTLYTITASSAYSVNFYDENGTWLNPGYLPNAGSGQSSISYVNEKVVVPSGAKTVRLTRTTSNNTIACLAHLPLPQTLVKSTVTPETLIYGTVTIDEAMPLDANSNSEIAKTTRQSAFGIMFPTSYANIGRPTPVIAMFHGSAGCVTPSALGYDSSYTQWPIWRQQYLDAGFAVMDINGYGVSASNDQFSKPYGNPQSVETLDKAWEYIKLKYNVCDKLLLHGTSMGGANAMAYLLNHPDKVSGVGLFAPAVNQYLITYVNRDGTEIPTAWGYNNAAAMRNDGFSKMIGYAPFMEDDFDWASIKNEADYNLSTHVAASYVTFAMFKTKLANVPIRIWQGSDDANVPLQSTQALANCLKRANVPVSLRVCEGEVHTASGGAVAYVRNEAVSWFKRFANS